MSALCFLKSRMISFVFVVFKCMVVDWEPCCKFQYFIGRPIHSGAQNPHITDLWLTICYTIWQWKDLHVHKWLRNMHYQVTALIIVTMLFNSIFIFQSGKCDPQLKWCPCNTTLTQWAGIVIVFFSSPFLSFSLSSQANSKMLWAQTLSWVQIALISFPLKSKLLHSTQLLQHKRGNRGLVDQSGYIDSLLQSVVLVCSLSKTDMSPQWGGFFLAAATCRLIQYNVLERNTIGAI